MLRPRSRLVNKLQGKRILDQLHQRFSLEDQPTPPRGCEICVATRIGLLYEPRRDLDLGDIDIQIAEQFSELILYDTPTR
jgi:hypothetical protein